MKSFKFRIAGVGLLLFVGLVATCWAQKTPARDDAATSQVAGNQVTLTLVRWPFT